MLDPDAWGRLRARPLRWVVLVCTLLACAWVFVQNAWLCDDAFITFRTIDNWAHGFGLRWNIVERVQTYTHPLWLLLLATANVWTGELYWTSLGISCALFVAVIAWVLLAPSAGGSGRIAVRWLAVTLLSVSRAVVDYSSSGLESPLTYTLIAGFAWVFFTDPGGARQLLWLSLLASALALTRLDLLVLVLPALSWALWTDLRSRRRPWSAGFRDLLWGATPLIAWELFSVVYYGFPFPNTAYAKLATGLPASDLLAQGGRYLGLSLRHDPLLALIPAAAALAVATRSAAGLAWGGGGLLYTAYVWRLGGDFMVARLLVPALVAAIAALTFGPWPWGPRSTLALAGVAALLGVANPDCPWRTGKHHFDGAQPNDHLRGWGVGNERGFYYRGTNPLWAGESPQMPDFAWAQWGRELRARQARGVALTSEMGMRPYFAGPQVHFLDRMALTDPLLARLPLRDRHNWRPGHFDRRIPPGYRETLEARLPAPGQRPSWQPVEGSFEDPDLAAYYRVLDLIVRGPLFSRDRLRAVVGMNLGRYDHLLERERTFLRAREALEVGSLRPGVYHRGRFDRNPWEVAR